MKKFMYKLNRKQKVLLSFLGVMLLISLLIGMSYGFYSYSENQDGRIITESDCYHRTSVHCCSVFLR